MAPSVSPSIQWTFAPSVLVGVGILAVLYGLAWRRARATDSAHRPGWGRLDLFALGLLVILVALVSPVDGLADQLLLMHMIQHVLLLDAVPILLILGTNKMLLRPATRRVHVIERRAGYLAHPAFAVFFYAAIMWVWHVPAMYDAALNSTTVHAFEHICFRLAGGLYWWHLLSPIRSRMAARRARAGALHGRHEAARRGPRRRARVRADAIYPYYEHHQHYWRLTAAAGPVAGRVS